MTDAEHPGGHPAVADGRSVRWVRHREERRASLVDSTIRAIRRYGAGVGMDDIAAEAGTSKTVIYRHFEDRAGLYRAVVERVDERVVGDVVAALKRSSATGTDPRELISSTVGAYLGLVESDTDLYRFVVNRPMVDRPLKDDPVGATVGHVTDQLARLLEASSSDDDIAPATWRVRAVALVGAVQAVADEWLASPVRVPRAELVESLTEFVWHGLAPVLSPKRPDPRPDRSEGRDRAGS